MKKHQMKKKTKSIIIISSIIALLILLTLAFGLRQTIFTPDTPDTTLDKYVNKYYFPTIAKPTTITSNVNDRYYCDSNTIDVIPASKTTRKIVERCKTGCEYVDMNVDTGKVKVVKCKGDYDPDIKVCSTDKHWFYTTDKLGKLTSEYCCDCRGSRCTKGCSPPVPECLLVSGGGGNVNLFFYNVGSDPGYIEWVIAEMKTRAPFNEFAFNAYKEKSYGSCSSTIKISAHDTRIEFKTLYGYAGWGQPSPGTSIPGNLQISSTLGNKKWEFLLFHELGHIYTHAGHTNDGSIMDVSGGNGKFNDAEIKKIRYYLNSTK